MVISPLCRNGRCDRQPESPASAAQTQNNTGSGFITLAATLSAVGNIPVAGLTLLIGVDRFMSEARAITNLIGNGVAAVVVSKWERELDARRARDVLNDVATVEAEGYEAGHLEPAAGVPETAATAAER